MFALIYTSTFLKNVKECRDVIVEKVYKQGRDGSHTSRFDLIAPYIVVAYITVYVVPVLVNDCV